VDAKRKLRLARDQAFRSRRQSKGLSKEAKQ